MSVKLSHNYQFKIITLTQNFLIIHVIFIQEWIKEKKNLQESKPLYEDPIFTVGQLEYKLKDVKEAYLNLKNIKKPKEPKKKTVFL